MYVVDELGATPGGSYEHLDDIVRGSADCVDWWFHRVPCRGWSDSPVVDIGCNLFNYAFRDENTDSLRMEDDRPPSDRRLFSAN